MHELLELIWLISAELLDGYLLLLLLNVGILLLLGASWETLPRKNSLQEVEENVTDGLEIISSRLLVSDMGVQTGVSSGTSQVFAISEWDMLTFGALVALGKTEIDDINGVFSLIISTDEEVVGLDISMNDSLFVHDLDSLDHLDSHVEDCLEIKFSAALLEKVFKRLTEHVHDHNVVHLSIICLFVTDEMEVGNCGLSSQLMDEFGLPEQHDVFLIFDSLFNLGSKEITSLLLLNLVDLTKGSTSELLHDLVAFV